MLLNRDSADSFTNEASFKSVKSNVSIQTENSAVILLEEHIIKKTEPELAEREVFALTELSQVEHIARLVKFDKGKNELTLQKLKPFEQKLDLVDISIYMKQFAQILSDIHGKGWMHMDISPRNIMKDDSNHLVLIDFALARHSSERKEGGGTPGYIAPEIYRGQIPSFSSDIYSTGVILGQLLELYMPGLSLHYLGSKLVRSATTTFICRKIEQLKEDSIGLDLALVYAADLLYLMLQEDPEKRISAKDMLKHPFVTSDSQIFEDYKYQDQKRKLLHSPVTRRSSARKDPVVFYRGM